MLWNCCNLKFHLIGLRLKMKILVSAVLVWEISSGIASFVGRHLVNKKLEFVYELWTIFWFIFWLTFTLKMLYIKWILMINKKMKGLSLSTANWIPFFLSRKLFSLLQVIVCVFMCWIFNKKKGFVTILNSSILSLCNYKIIIYKYM